MLNLIYNSQEINLISKKRKHSISGDDEIEGNTKRSRFCEQNDNGSSEELFLSFSNIGVNGSLTAYGEEFETVVKALQSSCSEQGSSDCYALLRNCLEAVKDLDNKDPQVRLESESSRSSRPPVRDQLAYYVDKKFYFERI